MKHGFIKVAAVTPRVRVADVEFNAKEIIAAFKQADKEGAKIIVFPELCLTGYSCEDLFLQEKLLSGAREGLLKIAKATKTSDALVFVGMPLCVEGKLYNTAAVLQGGEVLAFVPKRNIPNYAEFYEARHFMPGPIAADFLDLPEFGEVLFGSEILFDLDAIEGLSVAAEICEDLWVPDSPHIFHALSGATVIVNLSASNETVGKQAYRRQLVLSESARCICGYIYAAAGDGESSQDMVFGGAGLIAENGVLLGEARQLDSAVFDKTQIVLSELDIARLLHERRKDTTFVPDAEADYLHVSLEMKKALTKLTRTFDAHPFIPSDEGERKERCEEILSIQARGLAKRLSHIGADKAVLGISGGLDSTLTLLVTARTFDLLGLPRKNITAVTMPAFGTTDRTYRNACDLTRALGATLREINIKKSVLQHFADIGQDPDKHDVTYENSQARERTQILMDLANQSGALVIGTGDMSELALGWATYNGDHMSMYGTNAGIPKTLVSHLVAYIADTTDDKKTAKTLRDVLDTPVSPELLPPTKDGKISQKTEDLVGPYELHDFFLYYMLRFGFGPEKIFRIAKTAFRGQYSDETIVKWLGNFCRRFFTQQFKRSCLPDGPKVGSVGLSPRGDLRMPSDAAHTLWTEEVKSLSPKKK